MNAIMTFFAFGAIGFWLLLAIFVIMVTYSLEQEKFSGLTYFFMVAIIAGIVIPNKDGAISILQWGITHKVAIIIIFVCNVIVGVIWSILKWRFYVKDLVEEAIEYKKKNSSVTPEISLTDSKFNPGASNNKGRIINWIMYWPISMIWTLINDPVRKFFTEVYNYIQQVYYKISEKVVGKEVARYKAEVAKIEQEKKQNSQTNQ